MPYSDPTKQKNYQREWQRNKRLRRRLEANPTPDVELKDEPMRVYPVQTLEDLRGILELSINKVLAADIDEATRGKTINALVSTGIKLVESTHLERRVAELEDKLHADEFERERYA